MRNAVMWEMQDIAGSFFKLDLYWILKSVYSQSSNFEDLWTTKVGDKQE